MNWHLVVSIIQIISSFFLALSILIQAKGSGLGEALGGSNTFYSSKRGPEKFLFYFSVVMSVIFFASTFTLAFV
ncbi:MAG: hypothetical protein UR27_C0001G0046 [Candidatus Peregrinibacteria bacterium GW2011_GWA2_33_10]|nr:MAG: hypothetical protein UR27_C0001G0046 [Candidatus Peregrinibacteria bacterium GW2011_GWA2_33_10]KKP39776.1 MAG: hypothetical protein UR30_C0008G0045 [Candidatus Peregrinibacteria bacterium GW2011_GWC2_33_13]OGJ50360.1 MAG: preprotein translocase subunit SecG [Candidatus Peregrinibacteria bacterium RIFOXYA2_FULL_33_7]